MAPLIVVIVLVLIGLVVLVVGAPLRRAAVSGDGASAVAPASGAVARRDELELARRDELEAAREAKYREIRDVEMDFRTGKLSEQDYSALDAELRAEALAILDQLQALDLSSDESLSS